MHRIQHSGVFIQNFIQDKNLNSLNLKPLCIPLPPLLFFRVRLRKEEKLREQEQRLKEKEEKLKEQEERLKEQEVKGGLPANR